MSKIHSRGTARPRSHTAWMHADWYLGMVGPHGHAYHRHLALPALLELLDGPRGGELLDVGCGPGVLAPHVARRGMTYTGLDASPQMIAQARQWHAKDGVFIVGDARSPPRPVRTRTFDTVTFLFSLQDMHPLDTVLREAAARLCPGGSLITVLTHPCFRVPRSSGWGWDEQRKLHYRRIDRYLTPLPVRSSEAGTTTFHRPLQDYVQAMFQARLTIEVMRELAPTPAMQREIRQQKDNPDIPALLILRARKTPGGSRTTPRLP